MAMTLLRAAMTRFTSSRPSSVAPRRRCNAYANRGLKPHGYHHRVAPRLVRSSAIVSREQAIGCGVS